MMGPLNPKQFHSRIWGVVLVLALLLTFLCSNLYSIQYTNGPEYAAQAVARVAEVEDVPASRGLILDRNGKVLVSNEISYQVTLDMSRMGEPEERCANLLSLIQVAREEGVAWADTLPISASAPFTYTEEHPFYTASTNEAGEPEYQMTRLGRLAVYMGWIEDPEELAEGEVPEQDAAEQEEPGLWDRLLTLVGLRKQEEPREEPQPYRLPTAEELLGEMCRDLDIKGQGAVDEKAARAAGETVPTLNLGDMDPGDARAVAGVLYELYYRSRIADWPPYYFAEDVDVDFITRVKELNLRGVEIETASVRKYETEYAAHLLGYTGAITKDTWPSYQEKGGYNMNDTVGVSGAEAAFEEYLHGTPGQQALERNENGKIVSAQWLTDEETGESLAPQPGSNVFLTIDLGLQQKVEDTLAARVPGLSDTVEGAACVVEDVRTGEILASASYPTYSLPDFRKDYNSLLDDPLKPLNNRAFSGLYPPGSTFKMISAIAGLEEEIITPSTIIRDEGQYTYWPTPQPKCWIYRQYGRTHGPVNVSDAIEVSCNYFFYDVGRRVGIEKLDEYAAKFGLGQKTGVELSEAAGVVASPEFTESLGGKWYEGNVLSVAIGQESTQVTPIQLANYIDDLNIMYYEEPVHPLNAVSMREIKENIRIPVASGERIYTRLGYRPFFENRSLSVIQPDVCLCGGISEAKKICDMADTYDVKVQIHVCGGPISQAAALHVETAIPNFLIHEQHSYGIKQGLRDTCVYDYLPDDHGELTVPELPGIGQEITEETMAKTWVYTIQ